MTTDLRRMMETKRVAPVSETKENPVVAKKAMEDEPEAQIIVEERIVNSEGEHVKKYLRGKFLGKVCYCYYLFINYNTITS
jgi:hypothetical protein